MKQMGYRLLWILLSILWMAACGDDDPTPTAEASTPAGIAAPATTKAAPSITRAAPPAPAGPSVPAADHPRLWITTSDLARLRGWATAGNPLYVDGLLPLAERAKSDMDSGLVIGEDCGQRGYSEYPSEAYAEFFAFLSLIDPSPAARADYAQRARTLLMHVMDAAALGPASEQDYRCPGDPDNAVYPPFRDPIFFTEDSDRLRWYGEGFPLTVDWIYDTLTTADKATINTVFTRWGNEIIQSGYHHPEPVGLLNDPSLTANRLQVRWAGNNYFAAHMRNLGMMSLALDAADASPALQGYLANATGAWLYLLDEATRTDVRGGLLPEGFEYSPQTASYALQFLLALRTAGRDNPAQLGPAVVLDGNPFWGDLVTSYLHAISPATVENPDNGLQVYQPAWYGDAQRYLLPDFIDAFGTLAIYDQQTGNSQRLNSLRWIQTHTTPGGAAALVERVRGADYFRSAILYFAMFDPAAAAASDPRTALPTGFVAEGMQRLFSRTDWTPQARWLTYALSWNQIDHQQADGNHFEFYRNGEWLTKARTGYANIAEGIASSEFRNTLAIENSRPVDRDDTDWRIDLWRRGSQWNYVASADPGPLRHSFYPAFTYAGGDATNLYNSESEGSTAVTHASRDLVWLKPDWMLVYDRADAPSGNFKRVWWQLPQAATLNGLQARMTTAAGQQLFITALLPAAATMQMANPANDGVTDTVATYEPMTQRVMVEAPDGESVRFLHLVQGADGGASPTAAVLIESADGFAGAAIDQTAILFAVTPGQPFSQLVYTAPAGTTNHIITGLAAGAGYAVTATEAGGGVTVTVLPGGDVLADGAGVLVWPAHTQASLYLPTVLAKNAVLHSQ
ncbi:MAG: hypothetical protein DWI57_00510 [Chloroflexi bacterium]|nr:MAG: hypothetical protein DWI57_00510 [Chloroflexota bacterium]